MYIIVGLGNPGSKYDKTRHNMGFDVIDALVTEYRIPQSGVKFHSMVGSGIIGGEKVLLMKPLTYMNLSGNAVREAVDFYKIDPETELLVISDDIDLEPGRIRIRKQGSAGGQNGMKHIIEKLGTDKFTRIRVGTGAKPAGWDLADWVLSRFGKDERILVDAAIEKAAKAAAAVVMDGADKAMNLYNESKPKKKKQQPAPKAEDAAAENPTAPAAAKNREDAAAENPTAPAAAKNREGAPAENPPTPAAATNGQSAESAPADNSAPSDPAKKTEEINA